jgi:hypothetical protein
VDLFSGARSDLDGNRTLDIPCLQQESSSERLQTSVHVVSFLRANHLLNAYLANRFDINSYVSYIIILESYLVNGFSTRD